MEDLDPRELEMIERQRGQATFIHSIADQLGEARGPVEPVAPPPPPPAAMPRLLGIPLWAWAGLAAAGVAAFVVSRKKG